MNAAESDSGLEEELRRLEEDLARLRKEATDLRRHIGDRDEGPTDPEEKAALIVMAEQQEGLVAELGGRRETLVRRLGAR